MWSYLIFEQPRKKPREYKQRGSCCFNTPNRFEHRTPNGADEIWYTLFMKKLSLWTKIWSIIILLFILYPIAWYVYEVYIQKSTLLYETGITFMFFFGLAGISILIWLLGVWIKSKRKQKDISEANTNL